MKTYANLSTTGKPGVSLHNLQATELALNVTLDSQYKKLFQLVNAPEFGEWIFYPIKDTNNLKKTFDDVVRNTNLSRESWLPEEYVVIAENGTGDYVCMLSENQQVYYANHETNSLEVVADNLKDFIDQIAKI
ncbi:SMI1/KNR4 family protein [Listeria booriae]|uniref:SMI1/KNR4 family protein n=1 Tax=Listeria booriae TaxID=1552123 RepID=UPI00162823CF|nr:SMI1/KNR4 family protein [Listeria booriae]MBC1227610.1 SMI1/KNR4 family protein [Listeria booriae]